MWVVERKPGLCSSPSLGVHSEAQGSPAATPHPMRVWVLEKGFREAGALAVVRPPQTPAPSLGKD